MHSSIDGNAGSPSAKLAHGLVYVDYYLPEFANEALTLQKAQLSQKQAASRLPSVTRL